MILKNRSEIRDNLPVPRFQTYSVLFLMNIVCELRHHIFNKYYSHGVRYLIYLP